MNIHLKIFDYFKKFVFFCIIYNIKLMAILKLQYVKKKLKITCLKYQKLDIKKTKLMQIQLWIKLKSDIL